VAASPSMSVDEARSDRTLTHLFRDITFEPVFIIGDHRSGTTVLYELLASTGAFTILTAYDIVRYEQLVSLHVAGDAGQAREALAKRFAELGLANRGIDGVAVTPDSPEEYGYVIEYSARPQLKPRTRAKLVEVCQKLRFIGGERPVLLKSPWDVLTFASIKDAFPGSRFIFVHRHPVRVMHSQLVAARSLLARRNEYVAMLSPWYRDLFGRPAALRLVRAGCSEHFGVGAAIVGRHVKSATSYYLRHIGDLSPQEYTELRYEDLCVDPDGAVRRILAFLGRPPAPPSALKSRIRQREANILPDVLARYRRIRHRLQPYLQKQQYDLDVNAS